jgi:type 1 glutamine amidotransferase
VKVLVLSGSNHGFDKSAPIISDFLDAADGVTAVLTEDASILASSELGDYDAVVHGSGFTRGARQADGTVVMESVLSDAEEDGLFDFVAGGGGFVGVHGTAWCIGGRAIGLLGGHANWHPPGDTFTVDIANTDHEITAGIAPFEVEDEIYMSAWDPAIDILATAEWSGRNHPLAWTKTHGEGRVFYTALGHGPGTFERPAMQRLMTQGTVWAGGGAA